MRPRSGWLAVALVAAAHAQVHESKAPSTFERELAILQQARAPDAPAQVGADEIKATRTFLDRHGQTHATDVRVLQLRTRLGSLHLHACDADAAAREFDAVLTAAAVDARDLRGRAAYGLAQAQEMRGDKTAARATLERLATAHAGERYARFALVALERIRRAQEPDAVARFDPGPLLDVDGRLHRVRDGLGAASVVVYWSPDIPAAVTRLRGVCKAWAAAGGEASRCFAIALGADTTRMRGVASTLGLACVVVPCDDEFLDPAVLAAGVTRLPTTLLIGHDGAILGRDLALTELGRIAARLR